MKAAWNAKNKLERLEAVISSERFLNKRGLGKEVPFFIAPFPPERANDIAEIVSQLLRRLAASKIRIEQINLYDLAIELLQKRGIWSRILESEAEIEKAELKDLLQGVLDPETHIIPAISERLKEKELDVVFITGVGEVFPYLRSHNVINNLQTMVKDTPTVMFFPGEYEPHRATGASLNLFGRLHDDKHYRAFNIDYYEV